MLKFFWNGIKGSDGKLWRRFFSDGALLNHPTGTLTIYSKEYSRCPKEINAAFNVENDSDIMTDYFEKDRIRVMPSHPLYSNVLLARKDYERHIAKKEEKRQKKRAA